MNGKEIRAQIDTENLKGLLWINGGGAVALLAFLPSILKDPGYEPLTRAILSGLLLFAGGLVTALIHNHLRRRCSLAYTNSRPKHKFLGLGLPEPWVCHFSHLFIFASYAFFITAVIFVYCGWLEVRNTRQQSREKHTSESSINDINNTAVADKQVARIHFEQSHPFVNRADLGNDLTKQYWSAYFFQVQVFNESYDSNIRVKYLKLTDLRKLDGGVFKPWENAVPAILKWPANISKELSPRENVFVPFARIFPLKIQKVQDTLLSGNIEILQLRFVVARWNRQMTSHVPPGTHRFKLTVFFENESPAEAEFQLEWSGEQRESLDSMAKDIKIKRIN